MKGRFFSFFFRCVIFKFGTTVLFVPSSCCTVDTRVILARWCIRLTAIKRHSTNVKCFIRNRFPSLYFCFCCCYYALCTCAEQSFVDYCEMLQTCHPPIDLSNTGHEQQKNVYGMGGHSVIGRQAKGGHPFRVCITEYCRKSAKRWWKTVIHSFIHKICISTMISQLTNCTCVSC